MFRKIGTMTASIAATISAIEMVGLGKNPITIGIEIKISPLF
jgi:hypothetical protein